MTNAATTITVNQAFFQPLQGLATASAAARPCRDFSDDDYLQLGVQRVLESSESGRAFLQEHGVRFENTPDLGNYFAALRSTRRCDVIGEVNRALMSAANPACMIGWPILPNWTTMNALLAMVIGTRPRHTILDMRG